MEDQQRRTLLALVNAADANALQQLIVEYHDALYRSVSAKVDGALQRHIDPDDVLQDAYVAAFKAIGKCQFDDPAAFYAWLETIAANGLKQKQRAFKAGKRDIAREVRTEQDASTSYRDLAQRFVSSDTTPTGRLRRSEAVAAVLTSLARLSDDQRDVIRLRFPEGKPVAEVAAAMEKTEASVHALVRRGLRALRESLGSITRFLTGS